MHVMSSLVSITQIFLVAYGCAFCTIIYFPTHCMKSHKILGEPLLKRYNVLAIVIHYYCLRDASLKKSYCFYKIDNNDFDAIRREEGERLRGIHADRVGGRDCT